DQHLRRRDRDAREQGIEEETSQLPPSLRLLLAPQPGADLLPECFGRLPLGDELREIVIDFRKLLFLERREGQLVVDRLAAELLVGEILGEGLAKPPSLSGQRSAERLVDLRHRVGMPDLECQLLVAERARILTGLQDLDETARDVRDREIPWSRGPSLDR